MSTSDELRKRAKLAGEAGFVGSADLMRRAADEIDALQSNLDLVREMCLRRRNASVTTGVQLFAGEVLAAINKETNNV